MTPEQQETIKAQRREYNTMRQREIRKRKAMQQREQAELFILGEFQNNKTVYLFEVANLVFSCEKARTLMEELVKLNVAQLKTDSIWQAGVNFQPYLKQKRKTQYDYGRSRVRSS